MNVRQAIPGSRIRAATAALLIAVLTACGGEKDDNAPAANDVPENSQEAARFLTQATFGPTMADIEALKATGYSRWIDQQIAAPRTPHRLYIDRMAADLAATQATISQTHFRESYWAQALAGPDQLRQRAAFALSQIFVVSFVESTLQNQVRGVTSYYDMLGEKAFGNYRDLLESVSMHPMMGLYLTSLRNQKEDDKGRVADENYAREIMQLFSIGLYELNTDGTLRGNTPVETYTHDDIKGLAKVFTGWSWYAGTNLADRTDRRFNGGDAHLERDWRPMQAYNKFHSTSEKKFLGLTIPANATPDAEADLKKALDQIFNHPNVGPFFGKLLIQRMVTSNPSPAYVGRVARAFNDNGRGVRGDLAAVFKAVLLDPEARNYDEDDIGYGKVREPLLRLSGLLRAFNARSTSGRFTGIDNTDSSTNNLSQTVLRAPTVFNFYRPGYVPPNSEAATAKLVAPELQLSNEVSVAGYLNYIRTVWLPKNDRDIQLDFSAEAALASEPDKLVDRIDLLLMSGQMSDALRAEVIAGVNGRVIPAPTATNQAQIETIKLDRVRIAIALTMASTDYLIQK